MQHGVARTPSPEGHASPPGDYTSWDDYMADVEALEHVGYCPRTCARLSKAMALAPNAIVFNALLEEQPVPVSALDQDWRRRYGL